MAKRVLTLLLLFSLISPFQSVLAQSKDDAFNDLYFALNDEVEHVYSDYSEFFESTDASTEVDEFVQQFQSHLQTWETNYTTAQLVYKQYVSHRDKGVAEVAQRALLGTETGLNAITTYHEAIDSESLGDFLELLDTADKLMLQAVTYHDEAVDLYNDYSGANSLHVWHNVVTAGTVLMFIVTTFLYWLSRQRSDTLVGKIRSDVYRQLTKGAMLMTIGLGLTTVTMWLTIERGGDLYLMYGFVIAGAWKFGSELYRYLTIGRKRLKEAEENKKQDIDPMQPPTPERPLSDMLS